MGTSMSNTAQLANALILPCKEFADRHNGKETIIVMMTTTMQDVNGMVVTAVAMTSRSNTAQLANALILPCKEFAVHRNGKETIIAMMKTTMEVVATTVVIAVVMMSTHNTAQFAPVWIRIIKHTDTTTDTVGENKEIRILNFFPFYCNMFIVGS